MFRLFCILLVGLVLSGCVEPVITTGSASGGISYSAQEAEMSNDRLCAEATLNGTWRSTTGSSAYLVALAKRRGLSCGIGKKVKVASSTYSSNASTSQVSSSLPACPSGTSAYWNNCFGSGTFSSGNKYVGEFKGGANNRARHLYLCRVATNT